MQLRPWSRPLRAEMVPPGDKSITHRAILWQTLTQGESVIHGWLRSADTEASLALAASLGVETLEAGPERLVLRGAGGAASWSEPVAPVNCLNSGTTTRLGIGLLTGLRDGLAVLYGDASLSRRPMGRVADPLTDLGASIWTRRGGVLPVAVRGGHVRGGRVHLAVASAQVKSALLLAGLHADGPITVVEPIPTRDHSERMLRALGARVESADDGTGRRITVEPHPEPFSARDWTVPGDPSSGAFWAALAAMLPGSELTLKGVSLNPGRLGFYRVLERMGAQIRILERGHDPEPFGDLVVGSGPLKAVRVTREEVPLLIDELPLVALVATQAEGVTEIAGAEELRVKESDRIRTTADGLQRMGAAVGERPDGFRVEGPSGLRGARVEAAGDHRIAMLLAVAAALADGPTTLDGAEAVQVSYPQFFTAYRELQETPR